MAERLMRDPAPNRLADGSGRLAAGREPPELNKWHEVFFVVQSRRSFGLVDGRPFSRWDDPRKLYDVSFLVTQIKGKCLIDNLRLRQYTRLPARLSRAIHGPGPRNVVCLR
jgi:hypothetical protein